jgi:hypothetical protein
MVSVIGASKTTITSAGVESSSRIELVLMTSKLQAIQFMRGITELNESQRTRLPAALAGYSGVSEIPQ